MERYYSHSIEAVREMIAREKWLGYRHDVAHVGHTQVNTIVGSMYTVFLDFYIINIKYTHMVFKYIYSIKKTLVVSNLILARRGSENVFDRPLVFKI